MHALNLALAVFSLMLISAFVYYLTQKLDKYFKVPYTVALVLAGLLLVPLSKSPAFSFLTSFELSPELLFYVFLPVLIYEAAYNINLRALLRNLAPISLLAIFGLLLSVAFITLFGKLSLNVLGFEMPVLALLLFGAIISATDPVAVIALFKEYGAPKRLTLLFEGESIFNDATAVAIFSIILALAISSAQNFSVLHGAFVFAEMLVLGVLLGLVFGLIFSKILDYIKEKQIYVLIAILLAHMSFLLAELINIKIEGLHISAIITTATAAIVMGNYGRFKLNKSGEKYLQEFLDYFAFLANSLVFLLIGLILSKLNVDYKELLPILAIIIITVVLARVFSVYLSILPYNFLTKKQRKIPNSWTMLLSWASLRGALALTMVLMIPQDLKIPGWSLGTDPYNFLLALVILSIYFTLFIKALSIPVLIKKLQIDKMKKHEKLALKEAYIYSYSLALEKIRKLCKNEGVDKKLCLKLAKQIKNKLKSLKDELLSAIQDKKELEKMLRLYAIGIEIETLKDLYSKKEINQWAYKKAISKLYVRKAMIEEDENDNPSFDKIKIKNARELFLKYLWKALLSSDSELSNEDKYKYYRALAIMSQRVIDTLSKLKELDETGDENKLFSKVIKDYELFNTQSRRKMQKLIDSGACKPSAKSELLISELIANESELMQELDAFGLIRSDKVNEIYKSLRDDLTL